MNYLLTGNIVMNFDLASAVMANESSSDHVVQYLRDKVRAQSLDFVDNNGHKLELCTGPSFYSWLGMY